MLAGDDEAAARTHPVEPAEAPRTRLDLGPLADVLGYHLAQAAVVTVDLFIRHVGAPFNLRKVEYSLLMLLLANGPLSPKRLAQTLRLSNPNLTLLLDRLQERGLLRHERNERDRRSQNIVLMPEGLALSQQAAQVSPSMERELLDRLSPAERAMLIELLMKAAGTHV